MSRGFFAGLMLVGVLLGGLVPAALRGYGVRPADAPGADPRPGLRRPVALAVADAGRWLFVANQRSGTVSVIDTAALRVTGEVPVGRAPSDLAVTPDGTALVVTDRDAGELVVLRRRGPRLDAPTRVPVGPDPASVVVSPDGSRCYVASRWSRRVTVVDLAAAGGPKVRQSIPLPFPPGRQVLLPDPVRLVAADAFGGRLAVIDPARGEIESVRELTAHNIRGLAVDDGRLLVSHQVLSGRATTGLADVHWGNLLTNNLREVAVAGVREPRADLMGDSRLHHLGDAGRGAGDPAGVAVAPGGVVVLALAGVGEVAVGGRRDGGWDRLPVGRRPSAVVVGPDGRHGFVANTFSDSVSVLDLKARRVAAEVPLGEKAEAAADRGEALFHDARLSHDGWFSCHSCHTDGHTNGLLADTMGDGSYGTPKRVPTLRGVTDAGPFGWTGTATDLGAQLRSSVETTMRGAKLTATQEADLLAYLRTLPPPPALNRFTEKPPAEASRRGAAVFRAQGCAGCHEPPTYTSTKTHDVDLADERGNRAFNPPSLRGVSQAGPYFHDGRARTLAEVFTKHRHGWKAEPGRADLDDLLSFLADL